MHDLILSISRIFAETNASQVFTRPLHEPIAIFALLMALILCVPIVCRLIRIPEIVGLIIAGIVLGPHALNIIPEGGAVGLLGKVGLIYIMFQAGLEIDMAGFKENRSHSGIFGVLSYAFPMIIGAGIIYFFLHDHLNHDHLWSTILLLASVFASHTLLSQPIVKRLGIMKDPAVTTAVGGTIVTDTLTLMTLAIIAAVVQGDATPRFWVVLFSGIVIYSLLVLLLVPRLSRWVFSKFKEGGIERFVYILAIVFICATLAEVVKMEAIIGAFFAGIAINRLIPERSSLAVRIDFVGASIFIPMFMITVGMIVDVHSLGNPAMWGVAVVIALAAVATKALAAFGSAKLFKYTFDEAMLVLGLCVSQAAATLAATFVGYDIGLFNTTILNSIIILILVTCILSPWMTETWGQKVARKAEATAPNGDSVPQRLLIPLANPATTEALMNMAILMHNPDSTEPLFPLTVAPDESDVAQGEKNLESAVKLATNANLSVSPVTRVDINVADGIIRALTELRIRTVLIGWNGQSTARHRIFGSILDRLLQGSQQTLFVYRDAYPTSEHDRVLLAIPPFSTRLPGFLNTLKDIWILCEQLGVELHIITPSDSRLAVEKAIKRTKMSMTVKWIDIPTWDNMLPELQRSANSKEDLIILMASRKRTVAWTRDNDHLPRQLAVRFPENSFMVVYPRHQRIVKPSTPAFYAGPVLRRLVERGGNPITLKSINDEEAIQEIAARIPKDLSATDLASNLIDSARANSVRVIRGTILIDVHDPDNISQSFIITANATDDAIVLRDLREPVWHIWVLVTGSDVTSAEHETLFGTINLRLQRHEAADMQKVHEANDINRILGV